MALVVKKWHASNTPDAAGNFVHLVGRESGLLSWFLSLTGIDPTCEVEIKQDTIVFRVGSLTGQTTRVIPMQSVTSAFYGYEKPWKEAVMIGAVLSPVFGIGLIAGPLYYFLNKTLAVGIVEASSWTGGFAFKRSVIEGQNIDENQAYRLIRIMRTLMEDRLTPSARASAKADCANTL